MAYSIRKSDGTLVTVADNAIDSDFYNPIGGSTGLGMGIQLIGRNAIDYGAAIAQTFLQLTENFSSSTGTQPIGAKALQGQLWYDQSLSALYVRVTPGVPLADSLVANWEQIVTSGSGNAPTASQLQTARNISATGDAAWTVSFDGSANVTSGLVLSSVNGNVGSFGDSTHVPVFTVNAKGLITGVTNTLITSPAAAGLAGGAAGDLPYQSAPSTTTFLTAAATGRVLVSGATPSWSTTPTFVGTNITGTATALNIGGNAAGLSATLVATSGGTAQTTYATGDTLYASAANTLSKLAVGTAGQVLTVAGGIPSWATAPTQVAGANTQVQFNNSGAFGASANLTFAANLLNVTGTLGVSGISTLTGAVTLGAAAGITESISNTGDNVWSLENLSNTSAANCILRMTSGGASAGDTFIHFVTPGSDQWAMGIDTSVSSRFALLNAATSPSAAATIGVYMDDSGQFFPAGDNTHNLGKSSKRWKEVFAGIGTINTSDETLKEQITDLTLAELNVAVVAKSLLKKFKFKDAVASKGSAARWHVGIVAQQLAAAFAEEGLDANNYGMFCSDTWYEVDGEEVKSGTPNAVEITRLGIRYDELQAFINATGNITELSDARLKKDVVVIENALDKVSKVRGVTYSRIDQPRLPRGTGVIAQELQAVLPEAVIEVDGMLTVSYGNIVGLLIEAIKELRDEVATLRGK